MKIEIKRLDNGEVILCGEYESLKDCIQKNRRADLSGANLSGADLSRANLRRADLSEANLTWANLTGADLTGANLRRADLSEANLIGADLRGADLSGADLSGADLSGADLIGADLRGADLRGANLIGADLTGADLSWANLIGADLSGADLRKIIIPPPMFLLAYWGGVSESLCLNLMRYDAFNHPHPEKFLKWAKGGSCPYDGETILRSANFIESRELIKDDFLSHPVKSAYELMQLLIAEKCKK